MHAPIEANPNGDAAAQTPELQTVPHPSQLFGSCVGSVHCPPQQVPSFNPMFSDLPTPIPKAQTSPFPPAGQP